MKKSEKMLKKFLKFIEFEIDHHEKIMGTSLQSKDFEKGFLSGLDHVLKISDKFMAVYVEDEG